MPKSRDFRACGAQVTNGRRTQDCLAGAGGFEPPHGGIKIPQPPGAYQLSLANLPTA
jgi:hypothetical protein